MKYFLVTNDVGNAIYFDHPEGRLLCLPLATTQDIVAENFSTRFRSLRAGNTQFVFEQSETGLSFLVVSNRGESEAFLRRQLRLIHDLLLMVFGPDWFEDLRLRKNASMAKYQRKIQHIIDTMCYMSETQQSMLVQAIERLEINDDLRKRCSALLNDALEGSPMATSAMLFVDTKLVAHTTKKKAFPLTTSDLFQLIIYFQSVFHPHVRDVDRRGDDFEAILNRTNASASRTKASKQKDPSKPPPLKTSSTSLPSPSSSPSSPSSSTTRSPNSSNPSSPRSGKTGDSGAQPTRSKSSRRRRGKSGTKSGDAKSSSGKDKNPGTAPADDSAKNTARSRSRAGRILALARSAVSPKRGRNPSRYEVPPELDAVLDGTAVDDNGIPLSTPGITPHPSSSSSSTTKNSNSGSSKPQPRKPKRRPDIGRFNATLEAIDKKASKANLSPSKKPIVAGAKPLPRLSTGGAKGRKRPTSSLKLFGDRGSGAGDSKNLQSTPTPSVPDFSDFSDTDFSEAEGGLTDIESDAAYPTPDIALDAGATLKHPTAPSSGSTPLLSAFTRPSIDSAPLQSLLEVVFLRTPYHTPTWVYCEELAPGTTLIVTYRYEGRDPEAPAEEASTRTTAGGFNSARSSVASSGSSASADGALPATAASGDERQIVGTEMERFGRKVSVALRDYVDYLITKAATHVTMLSYLPLYPGLVHFIFVDRTHNQVIAPNIIPLHGTGLGPAESSIADASVEMLQRKVRKMCFEAHGAMTQNYNAMVVKQGNLMYSYRLWFEDDSGRELTYEQPFPLYLLPIDSSYYVSLKKTLFPYNRKVRCFELYTMYLSLVSLRTVAEYNARLVNQLLERKGR